MKQNFKISGPTFTPIQPVYYELFESEQEEPYSRAFYFESGTDLEEASGKIKGIEKDSENAEFLCFDSGERARIDRIVTLNGKPGPAYDEYDRYGLACLDCNGGMD